jgi:hypothetical protein
VRFAIASIYAVLLSGCATQLPRATYADLAQADDATVCIAGWMYPNSHPDVQIVANEYRKRLNAGRFTHDRCKTFYQERSGTSGSAIAAALLAGAAGYYSTPQPRPTYTAPAYRAPAVVPFTPAPAPVIQPFSKPLLTQTVNPSFTQKVCKYAGTATTIFVQPAESCPESVPN